MMPGLDTSELVHVAMLRGTIAPISMAQCAHVHGYKTMKAFDEADELWHDIQIALDALHEFKGRSMAEKAQTILEWAEYMRLALKNAETTERAALATAAQNARELERYRRLLANYLLDARDHNGPQPLTEPNKEGFTNVEEARQTTGP
jgi:hypothetical protein